MKDRIASLAKKIAPQITDIRHDIHQHPELGYKEERTAGVIAAQLDRWDIPHKRCAGTGIVAQIGSGGHVAALRSEMDALPANDLSGLPYASVNEGIAHACGHDGHIAILLGVAWTLKQLEPDLAGTVKLIWQPAEEGGAGAAAMIRDGALETPAPEAIFAIHGWPELPVGHAAVRFGAAMASVDNFEIRITGTSTHAAMPHTGIDPVPIAAQVISGIQSIHSRMVDPLKPFVITVATIHGGSAVNVIPDEVVMTGTIRTIDPGIRAMLPGLIERVVTHTANASGADASFSLQDGYPPTINDQRATVFARDTIIDALGADSCYDTPDPVMGGEDFAYFLERIPGSFMRLGVGDRPGLHNSAYDFNDGAIPTGIRVMAGIAERFCRTGFAASEDIS